MKPLIIGISGKKRVGKNTFAELIADHLESLIDRPIHVLGFADFVKDECASILAGHTNMGYESDFLIKINADETKEIYRPFIQVWGDLMMNILGEDYWIKCMLHNAEDNEIIIAPDVRYPHMADWIKDNDGFVFRLVRDLYNNDKHCSEHLMDDYCRYDFTISNNNSLEDLDKEAKIVANYINVKYRCSNVMGIEEG